MTARIVVIESLLLVGLLLVAGYVFWETVGGELGFEHIFHPDPDYPQYTRHTHAVLGFEEVGSGSIGSGETRYTPQFAGTIGPIRPRWFGRIGRATWTMALEIFYLALFVLCCAPIIVYWSLQLVGKTRLAFWFVTLAALLPQLPALLAYNRLDWPSFWVGPLFSTGLSQVTVGLLFLLSLVLLVTLHRTGDLRRLQGRLNASNLEASERGQVITGEVLVLGGLVGVSLVVTALLLAGGLAVAQMNDLLAHSPWTVLTIGGMALLLLAGFLSLWLRTRERE